jgi:hypothetical protein
MRFIFSNWSTLCGAQILGLKGENYHATVPLRQDEIRESPHPPHRNTTLIQSLRIKVMIKVIVSLHC